MRLEIDDARTQVRATRLVAGFRNPIAAAVVGSTVYVAEFSAPHGLWAIETAGVATAPAPKGVLLNLAVVPNPLRRSGTLAVTLAEPRAVRVRLVDVLGRTVATLQDGPLAAGTSRIEVEAAGLGAGLYLATVETDGGAHIVRSLTVAR